MAARPGWWRAQVDAAGKRPDGLHQAIVNLYKTLLEGTRTDHHHVMSPWRPFAALEPDEFASKAKPLAARFAANDDEEKPLNPMVAQLFSGKPPADLAEVAKRDGKLFATIARVGETDRGSRSRIENAPPRLDNEAEDEIRQLIRGPAAPLDDRAAGDIKDLLDSEPSGRSTTSSRRRSRADQRSLRPTNGQGPRRSRPARPGFSVGGKPEEPGEEVPRRFLPLLGGSDANPFVDGSGRYDWPAPSPARTIRSRLESGSTGCGAPAGPRPGRHAQRLRHALRGSLGIPAAGPAGLLAGGGRLVDQAAGSQDRPFPNLSASEHRSSEPLRERPGERAALADEPEAVGAPAAPPCDAGGLGIARPDCRRSTGRHWRRAELPPPHVVPGRAARACR